MRERIEDLGRLSVLIKDILKLEVFEDKPYRNKDFTYWLGKLTEDQRESVLHSIPYQIQEVEDLLYGLLEIAEGTDPLNDREGL
jgi:hypothetical protein